MDKIYTVSQTDPILIYGAAQLGQEAKQNLSKAGYNVVGFIDILADDIKYCEGLPVWNKEYIPDKDAVLFISLQNGMAHKEIAEYYYKFGLNKIVMIPMDLNIPTWKKRVYRESYFKVMNGIIDEICVPLYHFDNDIPEVIKVLKDYVFFWLPIKHIYVFPSAVMWESPHSISDTVSLDSLPRHSVTEYYDLFAFLGGNEESDISNYLIFQKRFTDEQKNLLINQRKSMFETFKKALKYDMDFFTDSPARVTWEESKGGFIMWDGNHRSHFLIYMGYDQVPVYCSMEDFEKFITYRNGSGTST